MTGRGVDLECRAVPDLAVDGYPPAVVFNDAVYDHETRPGVFAGLLCGKERVEDTSGSIGINVAPGIGDG